MPRISPSARGALAAGAASAAAAGWALGVEPRRLRLRRETVRVPGWPEGLAGLRVAVVSDLHAGMPHAGAERVARIARAIAHEQPDLVVLLGDFVDATRLGRSRWISPERVAGQLAQARGPLGTVAVLGNHDWSRGGARVARALRAAGIRVLENEARAVRRGDTRLWIAGVADLRRRKPSLAVLDAVPLGEPVLLLSHDPDLFPHVPRRVSLTLAGHTHGGQINLPVVRRHLIPSRHGARYRSGLIEEEGRRLFVTRGVGDDGHPGTALRPGRRSRCSS